MTRGQIIPRELDKVVDPITGLPPHDSMFKGARKPIKVSDDRSPSPKFLVAVAACLSAYAFLGGIVTLAGWFGGWRRLTDWIDSGISMFANPAVAAICASLAIFIKLMRRPPPFSNVLNRALALVVAAIGALTLLEHLFQINFGMDTLLVNPQWGERAAASSGRMGQPGSTGFTLLGIALFLAAKKGRSRRAVPPLAIAVIAISLLGMIGYLFDANPLFAMAQITGVALQTATIMLVLGLALLASTPELEPTATLCRNTAASALARRALPFVFSLPILLGWLFVVGRRAQWFDRGMGTALLVLALIAFFCGVLWWCVADVARHENASREAAFELQRKNRQLAAFLETAAIGLHRVAQDGRILWANAAEMEMLGYTAEEYIGQHIARFHADEPVISDILKRLTCGERLFGCEARLRCKDGSIKHVLIDSSALREEGQFIHTQCFTRDITEKKRAEENAARLA